MGYFPLYRLRSEASEGYVLLSQACITHSVPGGGGGGGGVSEYGQCADGTHPIGMHSCLIVFKHFGQDLR